MVFILPPSGQHNDLAVAPEVLVKRQGIGEAEPLHGHKAEGVAKREALVPVLAQQVHGTSLIDRSHTLDSAQTVANIVQKSDGELATVTCADANEGIGLRYDCVRRDQRPGFSARPFKEGTSLGVVAILGDEVRKEGARVNEDASHGFVA